MTTLVRTLVAAALLLWASPCLANEEDIPPYSAVSIAARLPLPYREVTVAAKWADDSGKFLGLLMIKTRKSRLSVSPKVLRQFEQPQLNTFRITYASTPGHLEIILSFLFGAMQPETKNLFPRATLSIQDGKLASCSITSPQGEWAALSCGG